MIESLCDSMDIDGSRRISFKELAGLIRQVSDPRTVPTLAAISATPAPPAPSPWQHSRPHPWLPLAVAHSHVSASFLFPPHQELHISKSELPQARLHALWRVLDENESGFIDAGELSRFMRIGRPTGGLGARARMAIDKRDVARQQASEAARRTGKQLTQYLVSSDIPPASEDEVRTPSRGYPRALASP